MFDQCQRSVLPKRSKNTPVLRVSSVLGCGGFLSVLHTVEDAFVFLCLL